MKALPVCISNREEWKGRGRMKTGRRLAAILAAAMLLFSAWLLLGGIGRLQKNDPERVDAKKLRIRACGGLVAGALYLACRYLQL